MKKFIGGLVTGIVIWPIADAAVGVAITFFEVLKGKLSVQVVRLNNEIAELSSDDDGEEVNSQCIGFEIPNTASDDDDDW